MYITSKLRIMYNYVKNNHIIYIGGIVVNTIASHKKEEVIYIEK